MSKPGVLTIQGLLNRIDHPHGQRRRRSRSTATSTNHWRRRAVLSVL